MNSTKAILIGLSLAVLVSSAAAFQFYSRAGLQADQLANYETFVQDLQSELDNFAEQRVGYESQLAELSRELATAQAAISGLNEDLELAREQISPDVYLMEQEIRERVVREVEMRQEIEQAPTRYNVARQLASLDPEEMSRVMSLQSRYGGFLAALDVDEERQEVIVDALIDMMADQDQQRREVIAQNAGSQQGRRELRRQMSAISSPEAQVEAMSYVLDDAELAAFEAFQEQQRANRRTTTSSFISATSTGAVRVNETTTTDASGQIETRVIEMVSPDAPPN